jgi:hypothetical protein
MKKTILLMLLFAIPIVSGAIWDNTSHTYFIDHHNDSNTDTYETWTNVKDAGVTSTVTEDTDNLTHKHSISTGSNGDYDSYSEFTLSDTNYWNIKQNLYLYYDHSAGSVPRARIKIDGAVLETISASSTTLEQWYNYTLWLNESDYSQSVLEENGTNSSFDASGLSPPFTITLAVDDESAAGTTNEVNWYLHDTYIFSPDPTVVRLQHESTENFTIINGNASSTHNNVDEAIILGMDDDRVIIQWDNQTYEVSDDYTPITEDTATVTPTDACYLTLKVFGGGGALTDAFVKFSTVTGFSQYYVTNARLTDVTGEALIPLTDNYYYRYTVQHPDYETQTYYYIAQCDLDRTINVYMTTGETEQTTRLDVNHSFANTTEIITVNWSDPDAGNNSVNIRVIRETITGDLIICDTTQTGASNTTTCNVSAYTGTVYITVMRGNYHDYGVYQDITQARLSTQISANEGGAWAFLIMLVVAGIGIISPAIAVITAIIGLIAIYWLGLFTPITITFIIIAGAIGVIIGLKVKS